MGSFNTTCFASQQTISEGNKCRVAIVRQQGSYRSIECSHDNDEFFLYGITDSTCYAHSFWNPISPFFEATYADCGNVELADNKETLTELEAFFESKSDSFLDTSEGSNKYHDVPFNIRRDDLVTATDKFYHLMDAAHAHRAFILNSHGVPRVVQLAIMSEQAYQYLVGITNNSTSWDGSSYDRITRLDKLVGEIYTELENQEEGKMCIMGVYELITESMNRGSEGLAGPACDISDLVQRILTNGVTDEIKYVIMRNWEFYYAMGGLNALNIRIEPMVYAGQDYSNEIGQEYAEFIKVVSKQITTQQRSDDDEFTDNDADEN